MNNKLLNSNNLNRFKLQVLSRSVLLAIVGVAGTYAAGANAAVCEHKIQSEWGTGFVAEVSITNDTSNAIDGWEVSWQYANSARKTNNHWNANISGNNPYTATPSASWNSTIHPGQSVSFGMVVNGPASDVQVTGAVCEDPNKDTDGDGVPDRLDQCDNTPVGDNVDANGCTIEPDSDNDGVPDSVDLCPVTPAGNPVDADGCSLPDADNDGVPDSIDECPNSPAGSRVSAVGCEIEGTFRVDSEGNIVKNGEILPVQCGSWFGLEGQHEPSNNPTNAGGAPMELFAGNMWWANGGSGTGRTIEQTMQEIKAKGITVVRLPIAPQTLDENDPQGKGFSQEGGVLKNHESVRQNNAREAMTDFIKLADQHDIQVLVDIHSCSNYVGWRAGRLDSAPPYVDKDREGYDFTREDYSCGAGGDGVTVHAYNEEVWLDNLREIAGLSEELGVDNIIGIDLFNEPWDYTWQEWKTLAENAYTAINEVNPDILMFVEGIGSATSDGVVSDHGDAASNPNWGENLFEQQSNPLNIPKDRLVFSPHTYGPSVYVQNHFLDASQPQCDDLEGDAAGNADCNIVIDSAKLKAGWDEHFGYLRDQGYAVVVGEFGGNMDWPNKTRQAEKQMWNHITTDVDRQWQSTLVDYMSDKNIQGCYWSINPESGDTGGWYEHSYDPISNTADWGKWLDFDPRKTELLHLLWGM